MCTTSRFRRIYRLRGRGTMTEPSWSRANAVGAAPDPSSAQVRKWQSWALVPTPLLSVDVQVWRVPLESLSSYCPHQRRRPVHHPRSSSL